MTPTSRCIAVERVLAGMRQRLIDPMSLSEMASIAHLSPFHFSRVFRQTVGTSPIEFYAALRLDRAKQLLVTTDMSIADVCYEVGYSSLGTFTTRFTELVGLPPGRLRRMSQCPEEIAQHLNAPVQYESVDQISPLAPHGLRGRVNAPGLDCRGWLIFVGLFPVQIPQGRPVACTRLTCPGDFRITDVPDGLYYLFAAAVQPSSDPLPLLQPDQNARVGRGPGPIRVHRGCAALSVDVALRAPCTTDPPIVVSLPSLLAGRHVS